MRKTIVVLLFLATPASAQQLTDTLRDVLTSVVANVPCGYQSDPINGAYNFTVGCDAATIESATKHENAKRAATVGDIEKLGAKLDRIIALLEAKQ